MALSDGTAYLYIYPRTLTNCVVTSSFNGGNTGISTPTDNGTCLYTSVGLLLSATSHTEITITADGCLPQTLGSNGALTSSDYTITMEPAAGYKKLYAWKNYLDSIVYTDTLDISNSSTSVTNDGNGTLIYNSLGEAAGTFVINHSSDTILTNGLMSGGSSI